MVFGGLVGLAGGIQVIKRDVELVGELVELGEFGGRGASPAVVNIGSDDLHQAHGL
jgi:hypothetical protein